MKPIDLKEKLPSFWTIQLVGWIVYLVVIYITFLSVAQPENFLKLFYLKAFRAFTGFILTSVFLRQIYRFAEKRISIGWMVGTVLISAAMFGYVWTIIEYYYAYLTNPILNFENYFARSPRIALDYAMTLTAWSALYLGVKNWLAWQRERENALQANFLADKAQLEVLRYQLNPHFLFNALNSIRASVEEDKDRAKQMITQLSEFLRHSLLSVEKKEIPLQEEIEAVKNYLAIEKIRFEEKLDVHFDIEKESETYKVPCFILNPLVENAIKHGWQTSLKPLKIRIQARVETDNLVLEVANSGKLEKLQNSEGTKIGLKNVQERLEKLYSEKATFEITEKGEFVMAKIEISKSAL